jgi:hypothetical protein
VVDANRRVRHLYGVTLAARILQSTAACGVGVLLIGTAAHAQCTANADCDSDEICKEGVCTDPSVAQPLEPKRRMKLRSVPLMVTGIVVTALGAQSLGLLGLVYISDNMCSSPEPNGCKPHSTLTMVLGTGALVGLGVGIPMIVVGATRVPNEQATHRIVLTPWAASGSGGLTLSGNF